MSGAEKVKLFASRRKGKTSGATAVIERVRKRDRPTARVDVASLVSSHEVAQQLAQQLAPGVARAHETKRAAAWLAGIFAGGQNPEDRLLIEVAEHLSGDVLRPGAVLGRCSEALSDRGGAVLIDEAHLIVEWDPVDQRSLREFLRTDDKLGVIVSSSEQHALESLTSAGGPLEFVGSRLPLPPIAREDWRAELPKRFDSVGASIEPAALDLLLEESRCHPYCTMLLARESARAGEAHQTISTTAVYAGLWVAQQDEAWALRDD